MVVVVVAGLVLAWRGPLLRLVRALLLRYSQGRALGYGIVSAALGWLGYELARWSFSIRLPGFALFRQTFPDSLLYGMLGMGLLALALVRGREGLPKLANGVVRFVGGRRAAPLLLLLLGAIWLLYEALVVLRLPYVGHADYADNAVVARNLLAGRGWVVDYVTQFYQRYNGLTRPQETWPLLQPVWIAGSFALFGASSWAAKLPNLLFNAALLLLIYTIGAQVWDRRVGLTAAVLTLTSWVFFYLTIYSTSDLAFVVFSLAAIFTLYRARTARFSRPRLNLALSGLLTGLMIVQKPSSAVIAAGMGLWLIYDLRFTLRPAQGKLIYDLRLLWKRPENSAAFVNRRSSIVNLFIWGLLALLVISPYLGRNMALWGRPFYSTEQYDAWVLGYRGDSDEAWADIYKVYAPELASGAPGVPDRSWVLRWGFDQSGDKIARQVRATRDYLLPPWRGLPAGLSNLFGRDDKESVGAKQLLFPLGAWLSLAGLIAALRVRRRLLGLLGMAFVPYVLFLIGYWHANEERYFVMALPWLALLAAWVIWGGYERLAAIGDGRWAPLGLLLATAALVGVMQPSWERIAGKLEREPQLWAPDLAAYEWLRANTPADAAVMTRTPWQLNWHSQRPALMIPNTHDRALMLRLARDYGVDYLALETLSRPKGDAATALRSLVSQRDIQPGAVVEGFELVYASPTPENRVLIYRLPPQYSVVSSQ
jgi:hypothetical protein